MANKFEKAYQEYQTFDKAFDEAEARMDETGMAKARAAYKEWKARYHKEGSVFAFIYSEYEESRKNGNEDLNFHNYIDKTESCIACLKENGVKRFTFSSGWTGAIENAWELQKAGCRMVGMKEVKGKTDPWSGKQEILPALVFEINGDQIGAKEKMKTWQALKAADEGKKIRRKWWGDDEYSFKDEGERFGKPVLITHCDCETSFFETVILEHLGWNDIFADDWEIYEEDENERTGKSFAK